MTKNKLKYDTIVLEGIDRSGKDTIKRYLEILDNYKYIHITRSLLSVLVYNSLYNRYNDIEYNYKSLNSSLVVVLYCNEIDWKIRCKLTNEQPIDYEKNISEFYKQGNILKKKGINVMYINTSSMSIYDISNQIIHEIEKLNNEY